MPVDQADGRRGLPVSLLALKGCAAGGLWGAEPGRTVADLRNECEQALMSRPKRSKSPAPPLGPFAPVVDWAALPEGALLLVDSAPLIYHFEDNARFDTGLPACFQVPPPVGCAWR